MRARGRGRAVPPGSRGRGRGGLHRGRGRPRSLLSLPRAQASWAPQLTTGLTSPPIPCVPSQGEAPTEMGALVLEKEPRGAAERGECSRNRPSCTFTSPTTGFPEPLALNFFSSTVHGSLGDTPRSEETLPKANPDSLEPAGPSSPASVTVTVGDEGADTPVGATPLVGDESENLEGDGDLHGGRLLLGERLGILEGEWGILWLCLFSYLASACRPVFQVMPQNHSRLPPARGVPVPAEPRCQ